MSCCRCTMPLGRPVEPDEYIQNAISSRWCRLPARSVGKSLQPLLRRRWLFGTACSPAAPLTTISVCSGVSLQASASNRDAELGIGDRHGGAGIREIELQQVRRRQRVDQQRHEARAHRAEERRRIGRRVVEEHQDAVAALQAQRLEAVAPLRGLGAELAHSCACRRGRSAPAGRRGRARDCRTGCGWRYSFPESQSRFRARRDCRAGT